MTTAHEQTTRDLLDRLVRQGKAPNGTPAEAAGPWAELITSLYDAHQRGGTEAVRRAWGGTMAHTPGLAAMLAGDPAGPKRKEEWTVAELYATEFPEPEWAVPGIVPTGLVSLAGRPKLGKSWLALQIACAVATGGMALGQEVRQGNVLFFALEDSPRRLQERIQKQGIPQSAPITFITDWKPLSDGGLANLQERIAKDRPRLAVIDTFSRIVGHVKQNEGEDMTAIVGNLQRITMLYNFCLLMNDHHRKPNGFEPNPIDDIMGSTAKAAVVDCALGLYREQGKKGATLKVIGRDVQEQTLSLEWDGELCCWQYAGEASAIQITERRKEILDALEALGPSKLKAIADAVGQPKSNTYNRLQDLAKAGMVLRKATGEDVTYSLPQEE